MSMSDPISDFIARVNNAQRASLQAVVVPFSNLKKNITDILLANGYLKEYVILGEKQTKVLKITLSYKNGTGVIKEFKKVSKPGCRVYKPLSFFKSNKYFNGLGLYLLSTSKGIMTDVEAQKHNVGGEVICKIY